MKMLAAFCALIGLSCPALGLDYSTYRDVQYGMSVQENADLYILNHGVNPLVVMIHGGAWAAGDKSAYSNLAKKYLEAGFSVAAINYRLSSDAPASQWNVQLQDVQAAVRWLRASAPNLHVDPNRIGAIGDSAGGHLALFLGSLDYIMINTNPAAKDRSQQYQGISPKVQVVGDFFGPSDLTAGDVRSLTDRITIFGHKTYDQAPDLYKSASPIFYMDKNTAPTCIMHGLKDITVPISQSVAVANRLQSLGVTYRWFTYDGDHGFDGIPTAQADSLQQSMIKCLAGVLHPTPQGVWPW